MTYSYWTACCSWCILICIIKVNKTCGLSFILFIQRFIIKLARLHLASLLCPLQPPLLLVPGVPSQPPMSTAVVHSSWKRESGVKKRAIVVPSLMRPKASPGNFHLSSCVISTALDSNIKSLIVCTVCRHTVSHGCVCCHSVKTCHEQIKRAEFDSICLLFPCLKQDVEQIQIYDVANVGY